jgi:uncharacterized protein YecE (DUF72 family)
MPGTIRIGISGWRYEPWRGAFYPEDLKQDDELAYASRKLATIEINGSFYSLQRPEYYARWRDETPDGFVFSVKGGRYITHMKRLRDIEAPLANFYHSGIDELGAKLGPFLWQFPPSFAFYAARLAAFFELLPRDTATLAEPGANRRAPARDRDPAPELRVARLRRPRARARRRDRRRRHGRQVAARRGT